MIRINIYRDDEFIQHIDFDQDEILIGRTSEADVQLTVPGVSRRHARLEKVDDGWEVADLGAANGVYVTHPGDEPKRVVFEDVTPDDRIHIEQFVLTYEVLEDNRSDEEKAGQFEKREISGVNRPTEFVSMTDLVVLPEDNE